MKKGIKQFLAGMCAVLVMPTGTVQNVLAKESEQALPVSAEKSINQELKLWYTSPAKIDTAETNGGEWMQQSLPLGNGNLGNLILEGLQRKGFILMKRRFGQVDLHQVVQIISSGIRQQRIPIRRLRSIESF